MYFHNMRKEHSLQLPKTLHQNTLIKDKEVQIENCFLKKITTENSTYLKIKDTNKIAYNQSN